MKSPVLGEAASPASGHRYRLHSVADVGLSNYHAGVSDGLAEVGEQLLHKFISFSEKSGVFYISLSTDLGRIKPQNPVMQRLGIDGVYAKG